MIDCANPDSCAAALNQVEPVVLSLVIGAIALFVIYKIFRLYSGVDGTEYREAPDRADYTTLLLAYLSLGVLVLVMPVLIFYWEVKDGVRSWWKS